MLPAPTTRTRWSASEEVICGVHVWRRMPFEDAPEVALGGDHQAHCELRRRGIMHAGRVAEGHPVPHRQEVVVARGQGLHHARWGMSAMTSIGRRSNR